MPLKKIAIFGSSGSVGKSTISVIQENPDLFEVSVLVAGSNIDLLAEQAIATKAKKVVIADESKFDDLKALLANVEIEIACGEHEIISAAREPSDLMMAAIVGFAGLKPIVAALEQGTNVALANKEPLVAAGPFILDIAQKTGAKLLPVDSEHNAIFQVFEDKHKENIKRIILTASGGPFRTWSIEDMSKASVEQAVAHPNWSMGQKISIDSATLMNKALEVIEAHYLFDIEADKIDVCIHPQSIIHSMVEYADGSILAQMGAPDMKTPIAYCLGYPERMPNGGLGLDLNQIINLSLEPVDNKKFLSIAMAYDCLHAGLSSCVVFNAVNEVAVKAFIDQKIGFNDITNVIQRMLDKTAEQSLKSIADIVLFDETIREQTKSYMTNLISTKEATAA